MLHKIPVLLGLSIAQLVITAVTADSHVINAEGLLINVLGHGEVKHFQVALGPDILDTILHAVVHADEFLITQIDVGFVAVIEGINVVVIGPGEITFLLKQCSKKIIH